MRGVETILRFEADNHLGVRRCVGIVTVDAVVLHLGTATQIPVPVHAAVSAMGERLGLLAVALRAQRHNVFVSDQLSVCQTQSIGVVRVVTGVASNLAVVERPTALASLSAMPEIEISDAGGSKLAIVVDSADKRRDQEIWNTVRELPGVIDLAVAMVAFDEDSEEEFGRRIEGRKMGK